MGSGVSAGISKVLEIASSDEIKSVLKALPEAESDKLKAAVALVSKGAASSSFAIEEATIESIHKAIREGHLTFEVLVKAYLDRIYALDKPTGLNSIIMVNPNAMERAKELDRDFQETGVLAPLAGIPVVVKDNFWTKGLQTTAGSVALKAFEPSENAFMVRRLVEAGAIVLCKSNLAEWALHWGHSMSSMGGETRNPYDLECTPAGSSGGTGAAVAANLGAVGLGSDTGNSVRGPASHCGLVGLRATMGALSRHGIVPLWEKHDMGGPMCRTVEDTARLFTVMVGFDAADPMTEYGKEKVVKDYTKCLDRKHLEGMTIGVFREISDCGLPEHLGFVSAVNPLFEAAIDDMKRIGATMVEMTGDKTLGDDVFDIEGQCWADICAGFKHDVNVHLKSLGDGAPFTDIDAIYAAGLYDPRSKMVKNSSHYNPEANDYPGDAGNVFTEPKRCTFRDAVIAAMNRSNVDVLIYPSWNAPPQKIGMELLESNAGQRPHMWNPCIGLPAITVPMGFAGLLPTGLQIAGRPFAEETLFKVAYAYEQATLHRKAPAGFGGSKPSPEMVKPLIPGRSMAEEEARVAQIGTDLNPGQQKLHAHPLIYCYEPCRPCSVGAAGCLQIGTSHRTIEGNWYVCSVCLLNHMQSLRAGVSY